MAAGTAQQQIIRAWLLNDPHRLHVDRTTAACPRHGVVSAGTDIWGVGCCRRLLLPTRCRAVGSAAQCGARGPGSVMTAVHEPGVGLGVGSPVGVRG